MAEGVALALFVGGAFVVAASSASSLMPGSRPGFGAGGRILAHALRRFCRFSSGSHDFASTSFRREMWRLNSCGRAFIASVKCVMAG